MSNKPKPKKSFTPNSGGALYPTTEDQRAWFDRHRFDVLLLREGEEPAKFDPEKLKYLLTDEAGMRPDPFDGTNITLFLHDEEVLMPRMDPPLTKEEIQRMKDEPLEGWIKYGPKRKKL